MNRSIDVRQLRYFIAVAEERSFRLAAERLHITQPPLSRQVADLERALGTRLLARDTRRVELTPAGAQALREFAALVAQFDRTVERVAAVVAARPRLRLGMLYWLEMRGLGAFERELSAAGGLAGVDVTTLTSHEAIARLRRGELDAALVAAPIEAQGALLDVIGEVRHAAFVPARSPLARRRLLRLADLHAVPPFFRFRRSANPLLFDHFARQYAAHGFAPRDVAPAQEALGVLAQIAAGRGCTIMPEPMLRQRHPGMAGRRLREDITIDLALAQSARLDAALRARVLRAARHLAQGAGVARHATPGSTPAGGGAARRARPGG